jgi:hypothetical protein
MKNDTFVTRLARGAVASTIAGAWLVPQGHSADVVPTQVGGAVAASAEHGAIPEETSRQEAPGTFVLTISEAPKEWTKAMEKEFRRLALEEAKGTLTGERAMRLEQLTSWRERLSHPRTTEEILLQLKRDRLLEKVADTLKDYVEFQEGTGKKRAASR